MSARAWRADYRETGSDDSFLEPVSARRPALGLRLAAPRSPAPVSPRPGRWACKPRHGVAVLIDLHIALVWIITLITLFVLALLVSDRGEIQREGEPDAVADDPSYPAGNRLDDDPRAHPGGIAIPSFRLLKLQVELPKPDITIKAAGNQWYWSYEYPADQGGGFNSTAHAAREDAAQGRPARLLAVDNEVVLPINKIVGLQVVGTT